MAFQTNGFAIIGFLGILYAAISPVVIGQSLTSTLRNGQFACLGSRVNFTCVTRGSGGIAWTSDVYIGPDGFPLAFRADFNNAGDIRTSVSNVDTVATLTRVQEDQGVTVLESTLSINPLPDPQNASVTCIHTTSGQRNTISFQIIGAPASLENVFPIPIQHSEGNCVVHTVWNSLNHYDVTHYEILANGTRMPADTDVIDRNVNGTRISALFLIRCGVYEISVSASNACGRSPLASDIIPRTPPHFIPEPDLPPSQSTDDDLHVGAIIGVSVVLGLLCLGLSITIIILLAIWCCSEKQPNSTTPTKKNQAPQLADHWTYTNKESEMTEKY